MVAIIILLALLAVLGALAFIYQRTIIRHWADQAQQKERLALLTDPAYLRKVELDRAYQLQLARQQLHEKLALLGAADGSTVKMSATSVDLVRTREHVTVNEAVQAQQLLPQYTQPAMEELYSAVKYNELETAMGRSLQTGKLVITPIIPSVHFKLVGGSGFGKSCLAGAMLDIATTCNDPDHLRIALLDLEYQTSRLFEHLPHVLEVPNGRGGRVPLHAKNADEVALQLGWLKKELNRRSDSGRTRPLLLVYLEEMLSLRYEVSEKLKAQMLADLAIIALRARKYGIFFLACMQTDYSTEELKEAQKQFRTRSGFAIDASAARAAGFMNNTLIKQNFAEGKPGQYVLEKPGFSQLVLAPMFDVERKLLTRSSQTTVSEVVPTQFPRTTGELNGNHARKRPEADLEQLASLREMLLQQKSQNVIIETLFAGMRNVDAIAEYRRLVAMLVAQEA